MIQKAKDTLTVRIPVAGESGPALVSLLGGQRMNRVKPPIQADNGISIASTEDIFGLKCSAVQGRAAYKDYFDIATIIASRSLTLEDGLGFALAIYGKDFAPFFTLKSLVSYHDLDEPLEDEHKAVLADAVASVDFRSLCASPDLGPISRGGVLAYEPDRGLER